MSYKVKVNLVEMFLKENKFDWYNKSIYYGKYWLEDDEAKDEDFNRGYSDIKVILNGKNACLQVNPFTFKIKRIIVDNDGNKSEVVADLSDEWIDYLLYNDREEYSTCYRGYLESEIEKLEECIEFTQKEHDKKMKQLYERINSFKERRMRG